MQAYDYLVKPVDEKQFEKTMERLYTSMQNASEDSLLVQKGYEGRIIPKNEIVFCEIIDRKIYLHLARFLIIMSGLSIWKRSWTIIFFGATGAISSI